MRVALVLLLSFSCVFAHASTWTKDTGWELKPSSDGVWQVLPDQPSANKPPAVTCASGNCTATKPTPLPRINPPSTFNPSSGFTKVGIALGLASRLGPWLSVGMAAYSWLKDSGLTVDPQTGQVTEVPDAQAVAPSTVYRPDGNSCLRNIGLFATAQSALNAGSAAYAGAAGCVVVDDSSNTWYAKTNATCLNQSCTNIQQGVVCRQARLGGPPDCTYSTNIAFSSQSNASSNCYLVATGKLTGVNVVGGLCPSGTPVLVAPSAVASKITGPITDSNLAKVWREVLDNGGQIQDTGVPQLTGPSQVSGPTTTSIKTTSTGTQAVTTTTTNYNVTYNTNNITINESKVVANPDGSTETVTQKPTEPCAVDPTSLACTKLGDPGTDAPSWQTKTITYQPDNLGFGGSCPAPWTGVVHGWTLSFSYQPACDVAPTIRAGLLALSTLGALLMIVTAVRT